LSIGRKRFNRAPIPPALSQRNGVHNLRAAGRSAGVVFEARRVQVRAMLWWRSPSRHGCLTYNPVMATSIIALTNTVGFAASIRRMLLRSGTVRGKLSSGLTE